MAEVPHIQVVNPEGFLDVMAKTDVSLDGKTAVGPAWLNPADELPLLDETAEYLGVDRSQLLTNLVVAGLGLVQDARVRFDEEVEGVGTPLERSLTNWAKVTRARGDAAAAEFEEVMADPDRRQAYMDALWARIDEAELPEAQPEEGRPPTDTPPNPAS